MSGKHSILVVEDDPDALELLLDWCESWHIQAVGVETAEHALKALQAYDYDGVIIDLGLPDVDGMSLLERIRARAGARHIPCIAITAFDNTSVRHHAIKAGFDAYFPKPFNEHLLHETVARLLRM